MKLIRLTFALAFLTLTASHCHSQESIEKQLAKELDFNFDNVALQDAISTLSNKYKMEFLIHRKDMESEWIDDQEIKITLQSKGQTLHAALDAMLTPYGLTWIKRYDAVLITTSKAAADRYSEVHLYKTTRKVQVARRVHSIQTSVAPQSWKVNGGNGDISPLPPDFIVIRQSPQIHREIAASFASSIAPIDGGSQVVGDATLNKALDKPASIDVIDIRLPSVLEQLAKKHAIVISIDQAAMKDNLNIADFQFPFQADVPHLSSALSLLLEGADSEFDWMTDKGAVRITTKSALSKLLSTRTHDVREVVAKVDGKFLVEALEYNVSPSTWQFGGGDGTVELTDAGKLIIHQSELVHREVESLLRDLRIALNETKPAK